MFSVILLVRLWQAVPLSCDGSVVRAHKVTNQRTAELLDSGAEAQYQMPVLKNKFEKSLT